MSQELIDTLRHIVGDTHVLTASGGNDLSAYEQDWRKRARGTALAVVRPANTQQVADVVKACAAAQAPVITQGGNTGLVVGSTPDASGRQLVLMSQVAPRSPPSAGAASQLVSQRRAPSPSR